MSKYLLITLLFVSSLAYGQGWEWGAPLNFCERDKGGSMFGQTLGWPCFSVTPTWPFTFSDSGRVAFINGFPYYKMGGSWIAFSSAGSGVTLPQLNDSLTRVYDSITALRLAIPNTSSFATQTGLSDTAAAIRGSISAFATNTQVHDTALIYQTQSRVDMHDTAQVIRTAIADSSVIYRDTFTAQSLRYLTTNQPISVYLTGPVTGSATGASSISITTTIAIGAVSGANIAIGAITNSNISGSAAIAYSKLNLTKSVQNNDLVNDSTEINGTWVPLGGSIVVGSGNGSVTTVTVNPTNGITATVSNPTTTPTINMSLTNTGISAGTYGSATVMPEYTIGADGRATAVTTVTIAPAYSNVTGTPTIACTVNGTAIANNTSQTVTAAAGTLTGTVLNASVVTTSVNVVGAITTGTWTATPITGTYIASSVALAGSPTTTTQAAGDSSTKIATTAYVNANYVLKVADTSIAAAYTLTSRDNNRTIIYTGSSNIAVTIPSGLALPFICSIIQSTTAAGTVTPTASSTTLYMPNSTTKTGGSAAWIAIKEISTNTFTISGWTQ